MVKGHYLLEVLFIIKWRQILTNMKQDGLNHVQTYIYWNIHEPTYNFNGTHIYNYNDRSNITQYLEIAKEVGMFVNVRIGPFVNSVDYLHTYYVITINYGNNIMSEFVYEIADKIRPYTAQYGGLVFF